MIPRALQKGLSIAPDRADRAVLHVQPFRDRVTCRPSFVGSVGQLTEIVDPVHDTDNRGVTHCLLASIPPGRLGFHANPRGYVERPSIQAIQRITPYRLMLHGDDQRARFALPQPTQKDHQPPPRQPINLRRDDVRSPPFGVPLHAGCQALDHETLVENRQRDLQQVEPIGFVRRPPEECRVCSYPALQNIQVIHGAVPYLHRSRSGNPPRHFAIRSVRP